jgi:hypothetical protein
MLVPQTVEKVMHNRTVGMHDNRKGATLGVLFFFNQEPFDFLLVHHLMISFDFFTFETWSPGGCDALVMHHIGNWTCDHDIFRAHIRPGRFHLTLLISFSLFLHHPTQKLPVLQMTQTFKDVAASSTRGDATTSLEALFATLTATGSMFP